MLLMLIASLVADVAAPPSTSNQASPCAGTYVYLGEEACAHKEFRAADRLVTKLYGRPPDYFVPRTCEDVACARSFYEAKLAIPDAPRRWRYQYYARRGEAATLTVRGIGKSWLAIYLDFTHCQKCGDDGVHAEENTLTGMARLDGNTAKLVTDDSDCTIRLTRTKSGNWDVVQSDSCSFSAAGLTPNGHYARIPRPRAPRP